MYALTLGGQAGAGAPEVGGLLSKDLRIRYVEKLAFRRLARNLGATAEAVSRKELSFSSRKDRLIQKLEQVFTQFGWYGADISMGGLSPHLLYDAKQDSLKRLPAEISDEEYMEGIYATADQFVQEGEDLVYVKRAGALTLRDYPEANHVGLFAPKDQRTRRIADRLSLGTGEAEEVLEGLEKARAGWYAAIADADPMDRSLYSVTFDIDETSNSDAAVSRALAEDITRWKPQEPDDQYDALGELYSALNPTH